MPYWIDFIFDSAKDKPTFLQRATPGLIMEFRRWPDPPDSGVLPPPMRIVFRKNAFDGQFKTQGDTTPPTFTAQLIRFESVPGQVGGDPVQEVRIMLNPNPPKPHPPGGYAYDVQMRPTAAGAWKSWDPRVVSK